MSLECVFAACQLGSVNSRVWPNTPMRVSPGLISETAGWATGRRRTERRPTCRCLGSPAEASDDLTNVRRRAFANRRSQTLVRERIAVQTSRALRMRRDKPFTDEHSQFAQLRMPGPTQGPICLSESGKFTPLTSEIRLGSDRCMGRQARLGRGVECAVCVWGVYYNAVSEKPLILQHISRLRGEIQGSVLKFRGCLK